MHFQPYPQWHPEDYTYSHSKNTTEDAMSQKRFDRERSPQFPNQSPQSMRQHESAPSSGYPAASQGRSTNRFLPEQVQQFSQSTPSRGTTNYRTDQLSSRMQHQGMGMTHMDAMDGRFNDEFYTGPFQPTPFGRVVSEQSSDPHSAQSRFSENVRHDGRPRTSPRKSEPIPVSHDGSAPKRGYPSLSPPRNDPYNHTVPQARSTENCASRRPVGLEPLRSPKGGGSPRMGLSQAGTPYTHPMGATGESTGGGTPRSTRHRSPRTSTPKGSAPSHASPSPTGKKTPSPKRVTSEPKTVNGMPCLEDLPPLKKGDFVWRKGRKAKIVMIDYSIDPPALSVKMEDGTEVGTEIEFVSRFPPDA